MVVKSQSIAQYVANLKEVFGELRKYDMCLNLEKCTFGVGGSKFLGFMITHQMEMRSPTNVQEVQKLNGRPASLSRFFLKLPKKEKPFYK